MHFCKENKSPFHEKALSCFTIEECKNTINILESIYNSKSLLLRAMKQIDRHGDGLIPKYDFINTFDKMNCHHSLRIELIEKITDAYINNDPEVIMIHYNHLINALCNDIKYLIDNIKVFPFVFFDNSSINSNKHFALTLS